MVHRKGSHGLAIAAAASILAAGCVTVPEEMKAPVGPIAAVPTCTAEADCARKWSLARTFVLAHAEMKIQTYSAEYLETFNSTDMSVAAQVNKEPIPAGGFRITAKFWCGNPFGCNSHPQRLLDQFNRAVAETAPQ